MRAIDFLPHHTQVVWECIRPDAFVFEPGPEPPVVVKPMTIHKDIQTLIDNERFADVKFRFQVSFQIACKGGGLLEVCHVSFV